MTQPGRPDCPHAIADAALGYLARAFQALVRGPGARRRDANVGIVTGTVSGVVVIDVDPATAGPEVCRS